MCACMYVHIYVLIYIKITPRSDSWGFTFMRICIRVYEYICTYASMGVWPSIAAWALISLRLCVCMYVCWGHFTVNSRLNSCNFTLNVAHITVHQKGSQSVIACMFLHIHVCMFTRTQPQSTYAQGGDTLWRDSVCYMCLCLCMNVCVHACIYVHI